MSADERQDGAGRPGHGRTPAEWTTFVVSSVILAVVVALIVGQMLSTKDPAAPRAEIDTIEPIGNRFRVHVNVRNDGDETAANVQVTATLGDETGDVSIDFLAGGEEEQLVFLFDEDPSAGELSVEATSYQDP